MGSISGRRGAAATANGQPALATYTRGADGSYHPHTLQVLTLTATGVARIVSFHDAGQVAEIPRAIRAGAPVQRA